MKNCYKFTNLRQFSKENPPLEISGTTVEVMMTLYFVRIQNTAAWLQRCQIFLLLPSGI